MPELALGTRCCYWEKSVHHLDKMSVTAPLFKKDGLGLNVLYWNKMTALATRCPPLENQIRRWKQYLLLKQDGRPSNNISAIRKRSLPLKTRRQPL
jgi:hypothetical protein